jgi:hypothetical protein
MENLQPVHVFPAPGEHLCGLAFDGTLLWHSDGMNEEIYGLEIPAGRVVKVLPCPGVKTGLAFDGKYLWQVVGSPKYLRGIDPAAGETVGKISLHPPTNNVCGIDFAGDSLWVGVEIDGRLQERSRRDGSLRREFAARPRIAGVAAAAGSVWYNEAVAGLLIRINPADGKADEYSIGGMPTGLAWDGRQFWVADFTARAIKAFRP